MTKKYKTFSGRLTRRVMLTVLATMVLIAFIILGVSFHAIKEETEGRYQGMMDVVSEKLGRIFLHEEICARNVFDAVWDHLDSPEGVMQTMEKEIKLNNYSQGYYMAFEPGYFPQYPMWFEPYMGIHDEKAWNIGSENHDYFSRAWYVRAKTEKNGFWTDPYYDDTVLKDYVCSFCMPLVDSKGRLAGICGSDMTLKWLMSQLNEINATSHNQGVLNFDFIKENSFHTFIVTRKGTYVYHPDQNRILKDNVRSHIDVDDLEAVQEMLQMKRGQSVMTIDGERSVVFFAPLESANWAMGIVVPQTTMWIPALIMIGVMLVIIVIGMVVVYLFCRSTIRQISSPLSALAQSADEVAKGNFNAPLPDITYKDELGQLRDSFASMQASLSRYMKDLEQTASSKTAMENELKIAYDIQMSMIPRKFPPYPKRHDIDIYGHLTPAKSVGGDLFDFHIRDEHLFFCIGDVSGKGVPAALLMTVAKNLFHTISMQLNSPAEIMSHMNNAMSDGNDAHMFVTLFIGVLDLKTGHLCYCNGGHDAPVIYTSDAVFLDTKPNILVGLMGNMPYVGGEMDMAPGTTILLYTDGLTEAMDKGKNLYTPERLLAYSKELAKQNGLQTLQLVKCLTESVHRFVNGAEQSDDLTMLAIRYLGPDQNQQ
jgi:sigma-B regulation protein RsbU (phosphoserine phosphatase)